MIIGITGGIGTGKSTVADYLADKGYLVISADLVAREIVEPGSEVLNELALVFGEEIIKPDGSLDRRLLASLAFSNEDKKQRLDEITHGKIIEIMMNRAKKHKEEQGKKGDKKASIVFMDVPLLFESGMDKLMDKVWVVDAPYDVRIRRIMERDSVPLKDIEMRLRHQMSSDKRREMADLVLENHKDKEFLYADVNKALNEIEDTDTYDK